MPKLVFIGDEISVTSIRNYIFDNKLDKGDSLVLNEMNYEHVIEEIKNSYEKIDVPINVSGILILKDSSGNVPLGKVQVMKNDNL